jgi:hypothetical protein
MDQVGNGITETEPDPNVNYAIFEQNESEERTWISEGIKMDRR